MLGVRNERPRPLALAPSSETEKTSLVSPDLGPPNHLCPVSPESVSPYQQPSVPLRSEPSRQDVSVDQRKMIRDDPEPTLANADHEFLTDPPPFSPDAPVFRRRQATEDAPSIHTPRTVPIVPSSEKGKSKWRLKFTTSKKAPTGTSGDSSSLSSTALEAQKLEEISLAALLTTQKSHSRGKPSKNISVTLSQNSTLALFWTQLLIHVWDVGTSPPTMMRALLPESTCILATVAKSHLAYIIGNRDQKLTV